MRALCEGLALAALVAACTDQPTTPLAPEPTFAKVEAPQTAQAAGGNGALIWRFPTEDGFCWLWDAAETLVSTQCQIVYRKNGTLTWTWRAKGLYNPTGKAVHYGPTNYPSEMAWMMDYYYDVQPDADGRLPMCDYDVLTDPEMNWLLCSTKWHQTISANGATTAEWIADPEHSFTKWWPFPW